MKKEIIEHLLGPVNPAHFIASLIFAGIGIGISLLWSAALRDQSKPDTPDKFSWKYLFSNNKRRVLLSSVLSILLVIVSLRFTPEIFNVNPTMFSALGIGLGFDRLGWYLKEKGILDKKLPGQ
jgi:hypothetical protein